MFNLASTVRGRPTMRHAGMMTGNDVRKPHEYLRLKLARYWELDLIGAAVFAIFVVASGYLGVRVFFAGYPDNAWVLAFTTLVSASAVFIARSAPGLGLGLICLSTMVQVMTQTDAFGVQIAVLYVIYAGSRYGSRLVVWLSGATVFFGSGLGGFYLIWIASWTRLVIWPGLRSPMDLPSPVMLALFLLVAMIIPWLLGLIVRFASQGQVARQGMVSAELDAASAREFAKLRERHAELARDVHDVVGHSLAVIIAQADSVRFIPDDEPERIREAIGNIAVSARYSLGEVRQVLASTQDLDEGGHQSPSPQSINLDQLIENAGASGHEVISQVLGRPQPLSPQLEMVVFRVLQELLTNSIKHGAAHKPITVTRVWDSSRLSLTVSNEMRRQGESATSVGRNRGTGLDGIRERLASVDGALQSTIQVDSEGTIRHSSMITVPVTDELYDVSSHYGADKDA